MKLLRNRDNIIVQGAQGRDKKLLANEFIWSPYAKGYVVPEWAFSGLPTTFQKAGPIEGDPGREVPRGNPFDLAYLPLTLQESLYPFQRDVALKMVAGPWGAWHSAGVGKTVTTIAAYKILREKGLVDGMLVVGPENGRHVWCGPYGEPNRWIGEEGFYLESGAKQEPPPCGIVYTTAAKVFLHPYQGWLTRLVETGRFILCLDECHQIGSLTSRFAQIRSWVKWCKWRWLLSATPTRSYPDSFWAMYVLLLDSDVSLDTWCNWFRRGQQTGSRSSWHRARLEGLGRYLSFCTSVIKKEDVAPWLPPVTEQVMRITLTGKQREWYKKLVNEHKQEKGSLGKNIHASSKDWKRKLIYLVSMASHPLVSNVDGWQDKDIAKLDALKMLISSIGDQKTCIWSWHPGVLDWLATKIGSESCVIYHGQVTKRRKEEAVHRFNNDPKIQFFLGNPSAAGTSLNLGEGTVRIFWDHSWSYVEYHQACERINRITRTKPISSYVLIGENTVEEIMWKAIQRKEELAGYITRENDSDTDDRLLSEVLEMWK